MSVGGHQSEPVEQQARADPGLPAAEEAPATARQISRRTPRLPEMRRRQRRTLGGQVGLASELEVECLESSRGLQEEQRSIAAEPRTKATWPRSRATRARLELVERVRPPPSPAADAPRRTLRPGSSPPPRPARAPLADLGPLSVRRRAAGTRPRRRRHRAPARGRRIAPARSRPPRRVRARRRDATPDGRDQASRSVASASARCTARSCVTDADR